MLKREEAIENIKEIIEYLENSGGMLHRRNDPLIAQLNKVLEFLES